MSISDYAVQHLRRLMNESPVQEERYVLQEMVGKGGMGSVYRAYDALLARDVAIKVLDKQITARPGALFQDSSERLLREATILAQLEHPGIVPVHDVGTLADGSAFYVMRLVRGERLDEHMARGMSRGDVLRFMLRLSETVAFANAQGVVHRDLKPGNIMIGPFGEVLVLDWGVAKLLSKGANGVSLADAEQRPRVPANSSATVDGMIVGTPGYMSPEQQAGASATVNQTADVFALGVIMDELLRSTAESPIRALGAIVSRATAASPSDRYVSALQLADDVRRWMDGQAVSAHREGTLERVARVYRQNQVAVLLVATYLVVRTIILLWRHI